MYKEFLEKNLEFVIGGITILVLIVALIFVISKKDQDSDVPIKQNTCECKCL